MNYVEIRRLSLDFRRLSSNLLNSDDDNADVNLARFYDFINKTPFIADVLHNAMDGVEYDYKDCFQFEGSGWASIDIPQDESCHIKAMYDYMTYIVSTENVNVIGQALHFNISSRKFKDLIQHLFDKAFKPMIDYINDQISAEMIIMDEERRENTGNTFVQNIQQNYGNANQQRSGTITTTITNNECPAELVQLLEKAIGSLSSMADVDADELENVKDDLESVQEQISSEQPKKNRLQKALAGIKNFAGQLPVSVAASVAANVITSADWAMMIQQIEAFIARLA